MAGVHHDQAHAQQHAVRDLAGNLIRYAVMRAVSPPHHDIGIIEHLVGQTAVGIIQRCSAHFDIAEGAQIGGQFAVDSLRVQPSDLRNFLFMNVFVPNGNTDHVHSAPHSSDFIRC